MDQVLEDHHQEVQKLEALAEIPATGVAVLLGCTWGLQSCLSPPSGLSSSVISGYLWQGGHKDLRLVLVEDLGNQMAVAHQGGREKVPLDLQTLEVLPDQGSHPLFC